MAGRTRTQEDEWLPSKQLLAPYPWPCVGLDPVNSLKRGQGLLMTF